MSTTTTTTTISASSSAAGPGTEDDLDPVFLLAATDPEAMKAMNTELVAGFRATGGRLGGAFEDVPLLLLTTTGARSGRRSTTPMN